jgi:parallel beta-helix repeat protein
MATFYIDPTRATNGVGSEADPFNVWPSLVDNNEYLQRAGTTANVSFAPFQRQNVLFGRYGNGPNPVINGGASSALALFSGGTNTTNIEINGIDLVSTGNYGLQTTGISRLRVRNNSVTGRRCGINIISNNNIISDVEINNVTVRNTASVNERSGIFVEAQNGLAVTNVRILNCNVSNCAGFGIQAKAAQGNSSSPLNGLRIENNTVSRNAEIGVYVASGMATLDEAKAPTNVVVVGNLVEDNGSAGISVLARNGRNIVNYNTVNRNNWAGITGTGGLQLGGATNTECAFNFCSANRTLLPYDGIGVYLDIAAQNLQEVACANCVVTGNVTMNHRDFVPNAASVAGGNGPSAGIMLVGGVRNCVIQGNVSINDGAGIVIWSWCQDNVFRNNTCIGNTYGVVMGWQHTSHNNTVRNTIIHRASSNALLSVNTVSRTTTGNLTVAATTGRFSITSSAADFATHNINHAIVIGTGYARITRRNSDFNVDVEVMRTLSSSGSVLAGSWSLIGGQDAGQWADSTNVLSDNANVVFNGTGQTMSAGSSGSQYSVANLIDGDGSLRIPATANLANLSAANALALSGTYIQGVTLRNGRMRPGYCPVGAYQAVLPRQARSA